jgi:hypothetical protein
VLPDRGTPRAVPRVIAADASTALARVCHPSRGAGLSHTQRLRDAPTIPALRHGRRAAAPRREGPWAAALSLGGVAVGQTRGVGEKSNDGLGEAVELVATSLSSVPPPASLHGPLELSTTTARHGGFARTASPAEAAARSNLRRCRGSRERRSDAPRLAPTGGSRARRRSRRLGDHRRGDPRAHLNGVVLARAAAAVEHADLFWRDNALS